MGGKFLDRLWMLIMFIALVATYPSWANKPYSQMSNYDAPWVYPALNPTVQKEIQSESVHIIHNVPNFGK
jgi:hypothetical protein